MVSTLFKALYISHDSDLIFNLFNFYNFTFKDKSITSFIMHYKHELKDNLN